LPVVQSLVGPYPVTYYSMQEGGKPRRMVEITEPRSKSPAARAHSGERSGHVRSGSEASATTAVSMDSSDGVSVGAVSESSYGDGDESLFLGRGWGDMLAAVSSVGVQPVRMEKGKYYRVEAPDVDLLAGNVRFPRGVKSVYRWYEEGDMAVKGLHPRDRDYALALVQERYNTLTVELNALSEVMKAESRLASAAKGYKVRAMLVSVLETAAERDAERNMCMGALEVLAKGYRGLMVVDKLARAEAVRVAYYSKAIDQVIAQAESDGKFRAELMDDAHSGLDQDHLLLKTGFDVQVGASRPVSGAKRVMDSSVSGRFGCARVFGVRGRSSRVATRTLSGSAAGVRSVDCDAKGRPIIYSDG